jgi:DNA-binding Lrp family transcriptional regulator
MGLGRPEKDIPEDVMMELLADGWTKKDVAQELGVSTPTLRLRIGKLQKKEGMILQYRALQSLELTEIEANILEAITPEKIHEANLKDLVTAFKILKDKELVSEGRPSEIKGLVGYLMQLEKEEVMQKVKPGDAIDAEIVERNPSPEEYAAALKAAEEDEVGSDDEESDLLSPSDVYPPLLPPSPNRDAGKTGDKTSVGDSPFPLEDLPDL